MCSAAVVLPFESSASSSTGTWLPWARTYSTIRVDLCRAKGLRAVDGVDRRPVEGAGVTEGQGALELELVGHIVRSHAGHHLRES